MVVAVGGGGKRRGGPRAARKQCGARAAPRLPPPLRQRWGLKAVRNCPEVVVTVCELSLASAAAVVVAENRAVAVMRADDGALHVVRSAPVLVGRAAVVVVAGAGEVGAVGVVRDDTDLINDDNAMALMAPLAVPWVVTSKTEAMTLVVVAVVVLVFVVFVVAFAMVYSRSRSRACSRGRCRAVDPDACRGHR